MLITTAEQAERAVREITSSHRPILDCETTGLRPYQGDSICGLAAKASGSPEAYYFPATWIRVIADIMQGVQDKEVGGWNFKYDLNFLVGRHCHQLPDRILDGMLAWQLINENTTHKLKPLAKKVLGPEAVQDEQRLIQYALEHGLDPKKDLHKLPIEVTAPYACGDVHLTDRMIMAAEPRLERLRCRKLWDDYNAYWRLLYRIENRGLLMDTQRVDELAVMSINAEIDLEARLSELAGRPINPRSHKQLNAFLGVDSTAVEVLETMSGEFAKCLLQLRKHRKQWATYCVGFWANLDDNNVLHPNFHFVRTGRLASDQPNLHAVPHQDEVYRIKDCFVARPGFKLLIYDYSQQEARLACHYSKDPRLTFMFKNGQDIHTEVANELGIKRIEAKPINFGVFYGMGKRKLARDLHLDESQAKRFLDQYHARFPGPRALYRKCADVAERRGFIRLWSGRLRHFDVKRNFPRTASNSLLQGGGAEITRTAMTRLESTMDRIGGAMLHQVHDSILFEIPEAADTPELDREIRYHMTRDLPFDLPMLVDRKEGKTWGELE